MRVAVLADIHGNLPALDAVLRDVDHAGVDVVVLNGDIVNAGSVGLGYGHSGASWAILGPDVVLRRTPYDADKAAAILTASSDLPGIANMAANVRFPESDAVALDAFTDTVGRQQAN
jgi:Icc-related predicted phosphoesterase